MKLLLPGGSGAGGIINWGGRVQKNFFLPGGSGAGGIISWGGRVQNHFSDLTFFFDFEFKNTSNLIFPGFKVPSERILFKDFKTGLTFCHMWFFNFQNLVRSCQHIGGTPCISWLCWEIIVIHHNLGHSIGYWQSHYREVLRRSVSIGARHSWKCFLAYL